MKEKVVYEVRFPNLGACGCFNLWLTRLHSESEYRDNEFIHARNPNIWLSNDKNGVCWALFALGKDALPPPNYSRDLSHPVSSLLSIIFGRLLVLPQIPALHEVCLQSSQGWLSHTPPPPPACHHCKCIMSTDVAITDTLFRAQEAVSVSMVQPTFFYISTRPPLPASALLWLSDPVPTRDRWRTALWFESGWMVESGGDWWKFGTHQILNCLKNKQNKTSTIWAWASVVRDSSWLFLYTSC